MFKGSNRRRFLGIGLAVTMLVVAGGAYAYFTGVSGSGTSSSTVGTGGNWSVALGTPSFSPSGYTAIYPGAGTETIPYTITNGGKGQQELQTLSVAMNTVAGGTDAVTSTGTPITGCTASWFVPVVDTPTPAKDVAPGATYTGNLTLTMTDASSTQDACKNAAPALTLTAG